MIFDNTITREDFNKSLLLKGLEAFTDTQIEMWSKDAKTLLEKSTKEELNDIEKSQLEEFTVYAPNLCKVTVVNNDLTKSLMYYRPQQVEWEVSEEGELLKSRSGIYKDTPENRKLGRVGSKFGGEKKGEEVKEDKIKTAPIKGIGESVADDFNSGKISLKEAAQEFKDAGLTKFVDTEYTQKVLDKYKKEDNSKHESPKEGNSNFEVGKIYKMPSGMGGTYSFKFLGEKEGKLRFKNDMQKDYGGGQIKELTPEQAKSWFNKDNKE